METPARAGGQAAAIAEVAAIANTATTGMTEVATNIATGVVGAVGVVDRTRTVAGSRYVRDLSNIEVVAQTGEATEATAAAVMTAGTEMPPAERVGAQFASGLDGGRGGSGP